jgi:plastocyanin
VFYSGTIASGDTWSKTFNETGTYEYHCNFHPSMKAKIVVTEKTG